MDPDSPSADELEELGAMKSHDFVESSAEIVNPDRGYYVGYNLRGAGDASAIRADGFSLAIALVNLEDYRDRPLDQALLDQIAAGFAQARAAGIKIIVRFVYNAAFSDDAPEDVVLGHIAQLTPVLHANADVISVLQGGFIGAWGEWHSSTHGLDDNPAARAAIIDALLASVPESRQVQIRTPMYKEAYAPGGPLEAHEAFSGSARARLGHHNDCFLASATDLGTFDEPVDQWESYVADDGRYTAIGGETCKVYEPKTSCEAAIAIMADQHWSYLNSQYHLSVLDGWVDGGCAGEIEQRLGYRLSLDRAAHTAAVAPGGILGIDLTLHNSGFAAPYNQRPVEVVLSDGRSRHVARLEGVDARRWQAGEEVTIRAMLRVPATLEPGAWTIAVRLPDADPALAADPRYAIQLANDGVFDAATGDNVLTRELMVHREVGGNVDPSATTFAEL